VTDEGVLEVCSLPALRSLNLSRCRKNTDVAVTAGRGKTALRSLYLYMCVNITNEGARSVSSMTALASLNVVRALSSLPALTHLDLRGCH